MEAERRSPIRKILENRKSVDLGSATEGSAVRRYIASRTDCIHKLKAKDTTDRWAYYLVFVSPLAERRFLAEIDGTRAGADTIDLDRYLVVDSCYGDGPSPEMIERVRTRYGIEL